MDNPLSQRIHALPEATIGKLLEIAEERDDIISLGPGEPDFAAPQYIIEAAQNALSEEETHYSPVSGRSELKAALVNKLKQDNNIEARPENIIATCGSSEALYLALLTTINPHDRVLVPDPGFLAYKPMTLLVGGQPVSLPLYQQDGFDVQVDTLANTMRQHQPRVLILNTPGNPTGTVMSKQVLEDIADLAIEHNCLIFADEAYEHFIYGGAKHYSIGAFNGMENHTITFQSFSKTFAMPGLRLGYAVGREDIINTMAYIHPYTTLTAPTTSQIAATEALQQWDKAQQSIKQMKESYEKRRQLVLQKCKESNIFSSHTPEGAFYAFPRFNLPEKQHMSALDLSQWFIEHAQVATVPGTEFGQHGEGFLRLSYATEYDLIAQAFDQMEDAFKQQLGDATV